MRGAIDTMTLMAIFFVAALISVFIFWAFFLGEGHFIDGVEKLLDSLLSGWT